MAIVVADTGALISLGLIDHIDLIEQIFGDFFIANAVWEDLIKYEISFLESNLIALLEKHVVIIKSSNYLSAIMDYGESESVILYKELKADFFLVDDNKARLIAESLNVNCIGSIGLLIKAKEKGIIDNLRPYFQKWIDKKRYFSVKQLNQILEKFGENQIGK